MTALKFLPIVAFAFAILSAPVIAENHAACCEKAKAAGKECDHKCCVDAKKEGKECAKCNKPKETK